MINSKIVIGTANFNQKYGLNKYAIKSKKKIEEIINYSRSKKIQYIDIAFDYNLKPLNLKKFKVITKIKIPNKKKKFFIKNLNKKIKKELKKFNIKQFEGVLLHDTNDLKKKNGTKLLNILNDLKKKKLIKKIGVSIYNKSEINFVLKIFIPEIIQFPINIFSQNILDNKLISFLKKKKVLFQARSIFLQGLLLKKPDQINKMNFSKKFLTEHMRFYKYCKIRSVTLLQACILFVRKIKFIDLITIGIDSKDNLKKILKPVKLKKKINLDQFDFKNINLTDPRKWKKN